MTRPDLPAVLAFVAGDLDSRGYPFAGVLRQAARRIHELERRAAEAGRSEVGCGWSGRVGVRLVRPAARAARDREASALL